MFHNSQSEGTWTCDSWSLKRTCWLLNGSVLVQIQSAVAFSNGLHDSGELSWSLSHLEEGLKLMCLMLHLAGEPTSPDAFR